MKGNKQTYKTIEQIVDSVCLDLGEGNHRKEQYLHWAIKEADRWKMDKAREVKTVQLTMTPWKAIELPSDCIDWIKLGIQDGDVIKTFINKNTIAIHHQLGANNIPIENKEPESLKDTGIIDDNYYGGVVFFNYLDPYGGTGKLFGQVRKDNELGYFTVNSNENRDEIQFSTHVKHGSKIYLEYLADSWNPNNQTVIHPYGVELIELGVHYRRLKFNEKTPRSLVAEAKRDYDEEYTRVIDRLWDYSTEDLIDASLEAYMLTANPQ